MKKIYLDNAATTPILPDVIKTIANGMQQTFGNPSSIHQYGRAAKGVVEMARKNIASHFNATSNEIIFTSGGSEANNLILKNAVENLKVTTIITTKIEHKAILNTLAYLYKKHAITVLFVTVDAFGNPNLSHLQSLLANDTSKKLVSLMSVNNEIGTLLEIKKVTKLCQEYKAYFHTDAVQAVGHFNFDVLELGIDFFTASAHKFHGPKGVGFAYFKSGIGVSPMLHGGSQEKGARAGTENVHGILGMEKALAIAYKNLEEDKIYITSLKKYFIKELQNISSEIKFNGNVHKENATTYTILNVRFPKEYNMLLFNLDLKGIAASGGSACQSGASGGSHVLNEVLPFEESLKTSVRFSFSKFNTKEELDITVAALKEFLV